LISPPQQLILSCSQQSLEDVASIVKPDTILAWHRKLVAQKFDGSEPRKAVGRPRVDKAIEDRVVQMAKENRRWGYDRIAGALAELGYEVSDQTVGNILKRRGLPSAPERKKTTAWREFIRTHMEMLWATDFFSTEVWTLGGLVTFYVLFFIKLDTREVRIAGVTAHPNEAWMKQITRNVTMAPSALRPAASGGRRYVFGQPGSRVDVKRRGGKTRPSPSPTPRTLPAGGSQGWRCGEADAKIAFEILIPWWRHRIYQLIKKLILR
jgi:hypothetical protein